MYPPNAKTILESIWQHLIEGTKTRHSGFHLASFHYIAHENNWPRSLTVVMRKADPNNRQLSFHTDTRQKKIASLQKNPAVSLLLYDKKEKIQISMQGSAHIDTLNTTSQAAWNKMKSLSKLCYLQDLSPGLPAPSLTHGYSEAQWEKRHDPIALEKGLTHFGIITTTVHTIEWLYLSAHGNTRIEFTHNPDSNEWESTWLVP